MRRWLPLILALLPLVCAAVWARSYWQFDFIQYRGAVVLSESGAVYTYRVAAGAPFEHLAGAAGSNGWLEVETGSAWRPWLPCWTWSYGGDRYVVVQWWTLTLASAIPAVWAWRRQRVEPGRGFDVTGPA